MLLFRKPPSRVSLFSSHSASNGLKMGGPSRGSQCCGSCQLLTLCSLLLCICVNVYFAVLLWREDRLLHRCACLHSGADGSQSDAGAKPAASVASSRPLDASAASASVPAFADQFSRLELGEPELAGEHRLCVVVPFRDRFDELLQFVPHMHHFLVAQALDFRILVVNQVDVYRFNRASLINTGYLEGLRLGCDYQCMHDVDLLPLNPDLDYRFPAKGPYHVAAPKYHPRYHYSKFIGGILCISNQHFRMVNGLSNRYWGWGLEDDEFYVRIREAGLQIFRPYNLSSDSESTFRHLHNSHRRPRDRDRLFNQKQESRRRDRQTGIDTLTYQLQSRTLLHVNGSLCAVLHVKLQCNRADTPWCLPDVGSKP